MPYIYPDDLKTYLDITETGDDLILQATIQRAEKAIESYTGRVFEAASDTRYYDYAAVDGLYLWLDHDLYSLTSVTNGDSNGTSVSTDDITLWPRNQGPPYYKLRLNESSTSDWEVDTDYWIQVTGLWGYSDEPPEDIVQATTRWAAYLYRQKDTGQFETVAVSDGGAVTVPMGMPEDVKVLLAPYRRHSL